ncbi:MAG: hypothetical protein EP315_05175 [Gammaproteobacteria bacterium]|nr:MAG: hypothetical protein EP315_05175 [Gammaproteobacteria bacterium]
MKNGFTLLKVYVLVLGAFLTACEAPSREQTAIDVSDSTQSQTRKNLVPPAQQQPLDLSISQEMLQKAVIDSAAPIDENQSQFQLQSKKDDDVQFRGRVFLEPDEKALLPTVQGAMLEIEVKTQSP